MQLQKAISDLFQNNKYGSLVPVPTCAPGPCTQTGRRSGRRRQGAWELERPGADSPHPRRRAPRTTRDSASRRRAQAPAGGLVGACLPGRLPTVAAARCRLLFGLLSLSPCPSWQGVQWTVALGWQHRTSALGKQPGVWERQRIRLIFFSIFAASYSGENEQSWVFKMIGKK